MTSARHWEGQLSRKQTLAENPRTIIPNLADLGIHQETRDEATHLDSENGGGDMTSLMFAVLTHLDHFLVIGILGSLDKYTQLYTWILHRYSGYKNSGNKLNKPPKSGCHRMSLYWPWSNSRFHFEFESQLWDEDAPRPPTVAHPI